MGFSELMKNNPIFQLGEEFSGGSLSMNRVLQIAESDGFLESVKMEHCYEIAEYVGTLMDIGISPRVKANIWAMIINHIGIISSMRGPLDKSLQFLITAKKIYTDLDLMEDVAFCNANLANLYMEVHEFDKALELYESALEIFLERGRKERVGDCYMNMASVFGKRNQFDKALEFYNLARTIYGENNDIEGVASCDINTATVLLELGQFEEALELFESRGKSSRKVERIYTLLPVKEIWVEHIWHLVNLKQHLGFLSQQEIFFKRKG